MTVILVFLGLVAVVAGWWLSRQRLMSKPWLEGGEAVVAPGTGALTMPAAKLGLGIFLVVVGALFALITSAYFIRMGLPDWGPLPISRQLWLNTGLLVLASGSLQWAEISARRAEIDPVRFGLLCGGILGVGFLGGQLIAWRELIEAGYFLSSNPANSFFYLITGLHGLHILGGLIALTRTTLRAWSTDEPEDVRTSVQLCTVYWHFMLLVWLVLFALLAGWADDIAYFVELCRQLLT